VIRKKAHEVPDTPQTRAPAYRLAFDDKDFLTSEELRPIRLQLELLKPEIMLAEAGVESTVVGPGVMEAGNRGAQDVGAPSIGLNIVLPHEQAPNEYVTPELCFNFHYFSIRKMHFLMRAKAIAVFPDDINLFHMVDSAKEGWEIISKHHGFEST